MTPVVDAHHHLWDPRRRDYPWMTDAMTAIGRPFALDDLRPLLAASGVDRTVAVQAISHAGETADLLAAAAGSDVLAGVVGWVDLRAPDVPVALAAALALPGGDRLVGVRHQVHDEPDPDWLLRDDLQRGIAATGEAGLVFDLLVRTRELPAALATAREHPSITFVVDHAAKPRIASGREDPVWAAALAPLAELPNVCCKLSGLVTEADWKAWTVALALGLLTFGVQATAGPHGLPLAVGPDDPTAASTLAPLTGRIAGQGGDAVSWRQVGSRAGAVRMLDAKQIDGALLLSAGPTGLHATVLLSGAVNPSGTQAASAVLTQVGTAVTAAARAQAAAQAAQGGAGAQPADVPAATGQPQPDVQVVTMYPTSAAGGAIPLATSALLWLGTLLASILTLVAAPRLLGRPLGRVARLFGAVCSALLAGAVALLLAWWWDPSLTFGRDAIGFVALVGLAFALLQTAVLRVLGLRGLALLVPLYLTAPAVASLVPELLNPVYRTLLWSWTPFRFSTETLRSLLLLGSGAPDVQPALWLFGAMAAVAFVIVAVPAPRRRRRAAPAQADGGQRPQSAAGIE